jgi:hypothetical protein
MVDSIALGRKIRNGAKVIIPPVLRGLRTIAPYATANLGAALILDSGLDAMNLPRGVDTSLFLGSLGLFNAGVVYPVATEGIGDYVRQLFRRNPLGNVVSNKARALGLASLSAVLVAGGREYLDRESVDPIDSVDQVEFIEPVVIDENPEGNIELEGRIQAYVNGLRERGLARKRGTEDYAIYMKDLSDDEVFVEVNADRQQMGASTLKVAVMAAAFEKIHLGKLSYGSDVIRDMERMICVSDNDATNRMINRVGLDYINQFVEKQGLSDTVVDYIPNGGRTVSNKTSARDLGNLLERIYEGKLNGTSEMKRILAKDCSGHRDRLVDKTCIPVDGDALKKTGGFVDEVYGKTGTIYGVNANGGIVEARFLGENSASPYVVVIMIEDKTANRDRFRGGYGIWGPKKSETLRSISEAGYWYMHGKHSELDGYKCKQHSGVHPQ